MAVFRVRLSQPGYRTPEARFKRPGAEPDKHRKENARWIDRVLSDEPITPKPIKLPNYTHDANPRPRRTSQI